MCGIGCESWKCPRILQESRDYRSSAPSSKFLAFCICLHNPIHNCTRIHIINNAFTWAIRAVNTRIARTVVRRHSFTCAARAEDGCALVYRERVVLTADSRQACIMGPEMLQTSKLMYCAWCP